MLNSSDVKGIASSDGTLLSLEELTKTVNQINIESGTGTASVQQKYGTYSANATGVNAAAFGGKRYDKLTDGNRTATSAEGNQSFAAGGCAHAYGDWAVSIGKDTKSYQKSSYSFGGGTQAGMTEDEFNAYFWDSSTNTPLHNGQGKDSSGNILSNEGETYAKSYSFGVAFGNTCKAFGKNSFAHGFFTQASGMNSIALNKDSRANGDSSIAIGAGCIADGENSFAAGLSSKAAGYNSFAAGASNNANGLRSVVFGQENNANGGNSFISGYQCNSYTLANDSACFGTNTTAKGRADFITGWYNRAAEYTETSDNTPSRTPQLICGRFNTPNTNAIFQVGNGEWNTSSVHTYSNAFEVLADGRAKVYKAPTEANDVVRMGDISGLGGTGFVRDDNDSVSYTDGVVTLPIIKRAVDAQAIYIELSVVTYTSIGPTYSSTAKAYLADGTQLSVVGGALNGSGAFELEGSGVIYDFNGDEYYFFITAGGATGSVPTISSAALIRSIDVDNAFVRKSRFSTAGSIYGTNITETQIKQTIGSSAILKSEAITTTMNGEENTWIYCPITVSRNRMTQTELMSSYHLYCF